MTLKSVLCSVLAASLLAGAAAAVPVTSNSFVNPLVEDFSGGPSEFTDGPRAFSMGAVGVTYSSTYTRSVYKFIGSYGLTGNGQWTVARDGYVGTNTANGTISFVFDTLVAAVGGFVNYTSTDPSATGDAFMRIYDSNDVLLEVFNITQDAPIFTPNGQDEGAFRGFQRVTADIAKFTISDKYIVLDDLTIGDPVTGQVPLPAGLPLLMTAFGLAAALRRRSA